LLLLVKHIDLFDVTLPMHVLIMPVGKIAVNEFILLNCVIIIVMIKL